MGDKQFFAPKGKGEINELQHDLRSMKTATRISAVKRVIANMTVGMDMSELLVDVLNCLQIDSLELKKLVYLFITANAQKKPEQAALTINSLAQDCKDQRPLVRALAVRTLGCIRVPSITEHLIDSLRVCLADEDPYVRRSSALCVAKLYAIDPDMVRDIGLLDKLRDLLSDSNAAVVVNAVVALRDVGPEELIIGPDTARSLLVALTECNEWGLVFIMEALARYRPTALWDVRSICERVIPYLSHANSAVVLSAMNVILNLVDLLPPDDVIISSLPAKLSPPLATLLSGDPEVQFVVIRNIRLILNSCPGILMYNIRHFFVKYNDPIYIKVEKLDILVRLSTPTNIAIVVNELLEYSREVDVEFVRKAVRAIGRCAIKDEAMASRCVDALLSLLKNDVSYVVEEVIVVFRDIFRRYPNSYEGVMNTLFDRDTTLLDPEAKAATIWMLGEYCERIDQSEDLLDEYLDNFDTEPVSVQLVLLTSAVKAILKKPAEASNLCQRALELAVGSGCPDLRDRGFVYWRLLSSDPIAAKEVVLAEKPPISPIVDDVAGPLADALVHQLGSLASVLHCSPDNFVEVC